MSCERQMKIINVCRCDDDERVMLNSTISNLSDCDMCYLSNLNLSLILNLVRHFAKQLHSHVYMINYQLLTNLVKSL